MTTRGSETPWNPQPISWVNHTALTLNCQPADLQPGRNICPKRREKMEIVYGYLLNRNYCNQIRPYAYIHYIHICMFIWLDLAANCWT